MILVIGKQNIFKKKSLKQKIKKNKNYLTLYDYFKGEKKGKIKLICTEYIFSIYDYVLSIRFINGLSWKKCREMPYPDSLNYFH